MQRADHNMLTRGAEALGWTLQWTDALDRVHPHGSSENHVLYFPPVWPKIRRNSIWIDLG